MPTSTFRPSTSLLAHAALALLLAAGGAAARADDGGDEDVFVDLPQADVDATVAATIPAPLSALQRCDPRATSVLLATRLDTSPAAVGDANKPAEVPLVKPTPKPPTSTAARPIPVGKASITAPASQLRVIEDQTVEFHADGLPAPNAPSSDPFARVLPREVPHDSVNFGARWDTEDKLHVPLGPTLALKAEADMFAGGVAPGASAVRRSLRLTAQWDDLADIAFGLTPGVTHLGGNEFEHHVTGLQATTLDPSRSTRWSSFVEVSGEKLAPNNVIDNSTAQVRAGASYQASNSTQFDVSVQRGTMDKPDTQSSVGLSMKF
jgi:hypothetical protein